MKINQKASQKKTFFVIKEKIIAVYRFFNTPFFCFLTLYCYTIMELALLQARKTCPFLNFNSSSALKQLNSKASGLLLKANQCPVMGAAIQTRGLHHASKSYQEEKPKHFQYEEFYKNMLDKKHNDKSYRYFNNINRLAKKFPTAHLARPKDEVTVWCANDYLGMGANPLLIDSMK